jgi:predicted DNA-binding transcriptional regulator YafY
MGRRGSTETATDVMLAFLQRATWSQAELARHVGVHRKTLVRHLTDLQQAGMRLVRDEDPPHVYWTVSKAWYPGAVWFRQAEVPSLIRVLERSPQSQVRDRLLRHISGAPARGKAPAADDAHAEAKGAHVVTRSLSPEEETWMSVMQEAVEEQRAVYVRYFTASRGDLSARHLSVQRVFIEMRKLIARCHRDARLKWFCLDRVLAARIDQNEPYVQCSTVDVDMYAKESVDGYHSGSPAIQCAFWVSDPDARWVKEHLPLGCDVEHREGGLIFSATTAGLLPLARFLVGLGGAVRVLTPELKNLVGDLAAGALRGVEAPDNAAVSGNAERISGARKRATE